MPSKEEILRLWVETNCPLDSQQQKRFLAHRQMSYLMTVDMELLSEALDRHCKLDQVAAHTYWRSQESGLDPSKLHGPCGCDWDEAWPINRPKPPRKRFSSKSLSQGSTGGEGPKYRSPPKGGIADGW